MKMQENMEARADDTPAAEAQREAIRKAIAFKIYEFDAHGVEMNQRYASGAVVTDGQPDPAFDKDPELHYQPTTWPGARLPHVWVYERAGRKALDARSLRARRASRCSPASAARAGSAAAKTSARSSGIAIRTHVIGPRQRLARTTPATGPAREVRDSGCAARPARSSCRVAAETVAADPAGELRRVFNSLLAR